MKKNFSPLLAITLLGTAHGKLVAHWSFDTDFTDSFGIHNGTAQNGASISTGTQGFGGGEALFLNGGTGTTAQHLTVDSPTTFNFNNDFTWHAYVKTTSANGGIFGRAPATGSVPNHNQGSKALFVGSNNAQWDTAWVSAPSSNTAINDDQWHQVIVTYVAATDQLEIFVDPEAGVVKGQFSGAHDVNRFDERTLEHNGGFANTSFRIGQVSDNFRQGSIVGLIDEAAIFDEALSGAELDQLISNGPKSFIPGETDPFLLVAENVVLDPISSSNLNTFRSIPIRNTGETNTLNLENLIFIGDNSFISFSDWPRSLLPGASDNLNFFFNFNDPGTYTFTIDILSDELNSPRRVNASIDFIPDPFLTLPDPVILDQAANGLGKLTRSISVTNTGLVQDLDVTAITFTGPDADLFSNIILPDAISPGSDGTISFDFDSDNPIGTYTAMMQVRSNAENTPTTETNLSIDIIQSSTGTLLGYWCFDHDASDTTGNHHGTLQNGAAISSGGLGFGGGEALSLNGGSGVTAPHVTTANPQSFDFNNDFTWHAYVKTTSTNGGIFGRAPATGSVPNHNQGSKALFVGANNAQWDTAWVGAPGSNTPINDDQWHQVIATYVAANDQLDIFVDPEAGVVKGQFSGAHDVNRFDERTLEHNGGFANTSFRIGQVSDNFRQESIVGLIDEAAVFDQALNGAQLDQLITSGPQSFVVDRDIAITEFSVSTDQQTAAITWSSRPEQVFTVIYSTDLIDWDNNLDDGILADAGRMTTRAFDITGLAGPNGQLFIRVVRQ